MHVDDRLATVLNLPAESDAARAIQYRQLLDLLGTCPVETRGDLFDAAHVRLAALSRLIPPAQRARAVAGSGIRLRNPRLIAALAGDVPAVALATIRAARLDEGQWLDLIPALPLAARGLLRMRRDLGSTVEARLDQLGITDRALPPIPDSEAQADAAPLREAEPEPAPIIDESQVAPASAVVELHPAPASRPRLAASRLTAALTPDPEPTGEGISAIVRRIERFRRNRELAAAGSTAEPEAGDSPRLPLAEEDFSAHRIAFSFATDATGRIGWADHGVAPMVSGILLPALATKGGALAPAGAANGTLAANFHRRLPVRGCAVELEGAPAIAGSWQLDATPDFDDAGHFTGYVGRFRRPPSPAVQAGNPEADRIRQVLHELRTPVNAIQGFAEVIQQQLFGPTPHEYRALAASITADAARMLAGFEELDRFARFDSGSLAPESGSVDLAMVVAGVVHQLEAFTSARSSGFSLDAARGEMAVGIAPTEAERLVWRLLATLAGAARPGEILALSLAPAGKAIRLVARLPDGLATLADIFAPAPPQAGQAVNAGVFGNGFTLRLAEAEARAAGGSLRRVDDNLVLELKIAADQAETGNVETIVSDISEYRIASAAE